MSKTVVDTISRAANSKLPLPVMCFVVPSITIENVAHKPMIEQFLAITPVILPESLWNIKKDNLPWTIRLLDFAIFTCSSKAPKQFILEPVNTSCTLGLNSRHHNDMGGETVDSTLGICLHSDTTSINMSINDTQLGLAIYILEKFLQFLSKCQPDFPSESPSSDSTTEGTKLKEHTSHNVEAMTSDRHSKLPTSVRFVNESLKSSEKIGDAISDKTRSAALVQPNVQNREVNKGKGGEARKEALSLWIQWTIPQIKIAAISEAVGQNGNVVKLELDMEDYLSSFDWTPVYFQMKLRIMTSNVHHFVRSQSKTDSGNLKFGTLQNRYI